MDKKANELIEKLFVEMNDALISVAYKRLNGDPHLIEDAIQETFVEICAKKDELMSKDNPKGFIYGAFKITLLRFEERRKKNYDFLSDVEYDENIADENSTLHTDEINPDVLYQDLADDPDYILLRRYSEYHCSVSELAQEFGITIDACYKRIQRARKRLRKYFENL